MKEISQHNKNYHFLLAPNANIESIAKNNAAEYRKANTACHISNDPDYLTEQLELEKSATDAILPWLLMLMNSLHLITDW